VAHDIHETKSLDTTIEAFRLPPGKVQTEVSWDMNATRVARAEHSYASPLASSTETVQQGGGGYSPLNPLRPLVNPFEDPSRDHSPGPLPIPTHSSNSTPRLSSPYEDAQELPNAEYTTALTKQSRVRATESAFSPATKLPIDIRLHPVMTAIRSQLIPTPCVLQRSLSSRPEPLFICSSCSYCNAPLYRSNLRRRHMYVVYIHNAPKEDTEVNVDLT